MNNDDIKFRIIYELKSGDYIPQYFNNEYETWENFLVPINERKYTKEKYFCFATKSDAESFIENNVGFIVIKEYTGIKKVVDKNEKCDTMILQ